MEVSDDTNDTLEQWSLVTNDTRYQVLVTLAVNNDWSPELLLMIASLCCNKKIVWKKATKICSS